MREKNGNALANDVCTPTQASEPRAGCRGAPRAARTPQSDAWAGGVSHTGDVGPNGRGCNPRPTRDTAHARAVSRGPQGGLRRAKRVARAGQRLSCSLAVLRGQSNSNDARVVSDATPGQRHRRTRPAARAATFTGRAA
jgi:hypothetical protein